MRMHNETQTIRVREVRSKASIPGTYQRFLKRPLDIAGALVLLVLSFPILLIVGVIVRLSIGSPVLFSQMRPGLNGKPFKIYKFRTMTNAKGSNGELLPDEERVTRVGQWIRGTSLDEFPEFYNVLKGDMSLVGPRPLFMRYLPRYSAEQARRHNVRPGITGWAQVNGRNDISWDRRLAMDVWYVDNLSLKLDVSILFKTVGKVLRRDGVAQEGHFSSPEFLGTE
jgi:sugar transferase EpsL